jgi:hypothetical protein
VPGLLGELAPLHPRNDTFPGEVFLHLAADALDWCGALKATTSAITPTTSQAGEQSWRRDCAVTLTRMYMTPRSVSPS